jgi:CheY-like chemotaxis protein
MAVRQKVLLLDDDQDFLELYQEMLGKIPSKPEVQIATSGARAIALLESQPFALLISDLNMPRMDGLQVLTIVRRKFPQLRTAVMTSVMDPQFRTRAYELGIDLFLEKPNTPQEITFFLDCIESLLGRKHDTGFRGVQSKSLVDIIQLECLSQSSSTLKVTNGAQVGRIWFLDGEVVDAEAGGVAGEAAFMRVLGWRAGSFETLPAEPQRERTIFTSYQGLLLESVQAMDEAQATGQELDVHGGGDVVEGGGNAHPLAGLTEVSGVQWVVQVPGRDGSQEALGLENPEALAAWVREVSQGFRVLGEGLGAGMLERVNAKGELNHVVLVSRPGADLCVGFSSSISSDSVQESVAKVIEKWGF